MKLTHTIEISYVHRDKDGQIIDQGTEYEEITEEQWQLLQQQALQHSLQS